MYSSFVLREFKVRIQPMAKVVGFAVGIVVGERSLKMNTLTCTEAYLSPMVNSHPQPPGQPGAL